MIAYLLVMNVGSYPIAELPDSMWSDYHMGDVVEWHPDENIGNVPSVSDSFSVIKVTDATQQWLDELVQPGEPLDAEPDPAVIYPRRRYNIDVDALYGVLPENRIDNPNVFDIETSINNVVINTKENR